MITRKLTVLVALCALTGTLALSATPAMALSLGNYSFSESFGSAGSGPGQLAGPTGVAVDTSTNLADPSAGDVYVVDPGNSRVEKFDSAGHYLSELNGAETPPGALRLPTSIAVDNSTNPSDPSTGDVYVMYYSLINSTAVAKFSPTGVYLGEVEIPAFQVEFIGSEASGLAVDPSGNLWVSLKDATLVFYTNAVKNTYVAEVSVFSNSDKQLSSALAIDSDGNIYRPGTVEERVQVGSDWHLGSNIEKYDQQGSLVGSVANCSCATGVAVDEGTNDLYVDDGTYVSAYNSSGVPLLQPTFGLGNLADGQGIAVNTADGIIYVADQEDNIVDVFRSTVLPDVTTGEAPDLTGTSTTLIGSVDPDNVPITKCEFEYTSSESHGRAPCESVPAGNSSVAVSAAVTGLRAGELYRYRLVAANENGSNAGEYQVIPTIPVIEGQSAADVSTTAATLQAQIDPTGRDTHYYFQYGADTSYGVDVPVLPGADIGAGVAYKNASSHLQGLAAGSVYHYRVVAINADGTATGPDLTIRTQSAPNASSTALPDERQYELVSPPEKDGAQIVIPAGFDESLGYSGGGLLQAAADGAGISYVAFAPFAGPQGNSNGSQIFSTRGASGWSYQEISSPHEGATGVTAGQGTEYLAFSQNLSQALVYPQGTTPLSPLAPVGYRLYYLRADSTGNYQPLLTRAPLSSQGPFVMGIPIATGVSPDFSHVVFGSASSLTANAPDGSANGDATLNLYEWTGGRLQLVSVLPGDPGVASGSAILGGPNSTEHAVSNDGSVFWTQLGAGESATVFMYDAVSERTIEVASGEDAFLTASEDGSMVFFLENKEELYSYSVASGSKVALAPGLGGAKTVLGVSTDGDQVYFATGSDIYSAHYDGTKWTSVIVAPAHGYDGSTHFASRVSPDGQYLVFESKDSLTGYENAGYSEVYEYDLTTAHLSCVSCNPTGGRPLGGSSIPGRTYSSGHSIGSNYYSRVLSPSGRVFFDSEDALVAGDTNGHADVYEWEPSGAGSCQESSGCIFLISAGTGGEDSTFVDASESGNDVFFITRDQLLRQDTDHNLDIYDAHVCSQEEPCFPILPAAPPPCSSGDGCKPGPTPQPSIYGAPASATFSGAGNLVEAPGQAIQKKKTSTKVKGYKKKHPSKKKRKLKRTARKRSH